MDLYALPDGRVIVIRPIRPDDQPRLRNSYARLSPLGRYRRFLSSKPHLSSADATYLAVIDGCDHYALVATFTPPQDGEETIIGVARFVRSPEDRRVAEFAIVVGDNWQGQGIGRELMGRLVDAAVTRGVDRFVATMLADNVAIRRLSERFAAGPLHRVRDGNTFEVEFPLPTREPATLSAGPTREPATPSAGASRPPGSPAMIAGCAGS